MMSNSLTLYPYRPAANRFESIRLRDEDREIIRIRNLQSPIASQWKTLTVREFSDNLQVGDFPSLTDYNGIPVFSVRAWETLAELLGDYCEPLPIKLPSGIIYFLVHVTAIVACLDEQRSEIRRSQVDGRISRVFRYAFNERYRDRPIFKLPTECGGELIVNSQFKECVEANCLRGLSFTPLPIIA